MGLYIPNMQMPTGGRILIVFPSGRVLDVSADETQDIFREVQAFPVSPHGRLGDLDTLQKQIDFARNSGMLGKTAHYKLQKLIKEAPTIIPADHISDATNMVPEDGGKK